MAFLFCRFSHVCSFYHSNLTNFSQPFIFLVFHDNIVFVLCWLFSEYLEASQHCAALCYGLLILHSYIKSSTSCEAHMTDTKLCIVCNFRSIMKLLELCCLILCEWSHTYVLTTTSEFRNNHFMDQTHIQEKHLETWQYIESS
jgi:hypothetical protein